MDLFSATSSSPAGAVTAPSVCTVGDPDYAFQIDPLLTFVLSPAPDEYDNAILEAYLTQDYQLLDDGINLVSYQKQLSFTEDFERIHSLLKADEEAQTESMEQILSFSSSNILANDPKSNINPMYNTNGDFNMIPMSVDTLPPPSAYLPPLLEQQTSSRSICSPHPINDTGMLSSDDIQQASESDYSFVYVDNEDIPADSSISAAVALVVNTKLQSLHDGYAWRKYGEKKIKGSLHPRSYFRCAMAGCACRKRVERSTDNEDQTIFTYLKRHNHEL